MSKNLIIALIIIILLVGGFFLFRNTGVTPAPAQPPTPIVSEQETTLSKSFAQN